jgi:hypothetical protein
LACEHLRVSAESEAMSASEPMMLIVRAFNFCTAGLLANFLFFSLEEH